MSSSKGLKGGSAGITDSACKGKKSANDDLKAAEPEVSAKSTTPVSAEKAEKSEKKKKRKSLLLPPQSRRSRSLEIQRLKLRTRRKPRISRSPRVPTTSRSRLALTRARRLRSKTGSRSNSTQICSGCRRMRLQPTSAQKSRRARPPCSSRTASQQRSSR
jgi:hypothetical protein